jgi:hypothetical protein
MKIKMAKKTNLSKTWQNKVKQIEEKKRKMGETMG